MRYTAIQAPDTVRAGKRGTAMIPVDLRRRYGLDEVATAMAEAVPEGILRRFPVRRGVRR